MRAPSSVLRHVWSRSGSRCALSPSTRQLHPRVTATSTPAHPSLSPSLSACHSSRRTTRSRVTALMSCGAECFRSSSQRFPALTFARGLRRPRRRGRAGICDRALDVKSVPVGDTTLPAARRVSPPRRFLARLARRRRAGVNVERPQPEARTNDVDAGDERRRISARFLRHLPRFGGWEHSRDRHHCPAKWAGRPGDRLPSICSRLSHGALRPQLRRVQSLSRPRHRSGGHAVTRTRALAVCRSPHAAWGPSRQRTSPSRRPK